MNGTPLGRLVKYLMELARDQAWAQLTITVQRGRIEMVHVNRSWKPEQLPLRDEPKTAEAGR